METPSLSPTPLTLLERFNAWIQESIMIKLMSIGFLILILLIPSSWINDLIYERQQRASEAMQEVASKWSGNQTLAGPVLVIPYKHQEKVDRGKDGVEIREHIEKAFFLPEDLQITGNVTPQVLHRGIFDAVVYESSLAIHAAFKQPDFRSLGVAEENILWNEASLAFGITDLRGISENPSFTIDGKQFTAEPSNNIGLTAKTSYRSSTDDYGYATTDLTTQSSNGITTRLNWNAEEHSAEAVAIKLSLKGSKKLDFIPGGKTTTVNLQGNWADPSFDGEFLPASREITEEGFTATWKVLHFNRPFSQQWTTRQMQQLSGADFGVKLLIPVDQYQKTNRTAKYGVLIILLTFIALFLVEIIQKIRIHPFQYILVGAALIIYYTLLLSFSEHIGYNPAYIISSLATLILISFYSRTFFNQGNLVILFATVLLIFYAFIFVIILQQDFSLLIGSIGLFAIVGMLMYFSRKVNWYSK